MEHEYFVYMVASRSRTLYVGVTRNLAARVGQHKDGSFSGFTADYVCTRLVWFERHQYVRNAILREKQIKRWRREKKVWLIERENVTWEDLAANWWAQPEVDGKPSSEEAGPSTPLRSGRDDKFEASSKAGPSIPLRSGRDDKTEDNSAHLAATRLRPRSNSPNVITTEAKVGHGQARQI